MVITSFSLFICQSTFIFATKLSRIYRDFSFILCFPHQTLSPPLQHTQSGALVGQLMKLHRHIIITHSPQFKLGFKLLHSMDFDRYIMMCYPSLQYHIKQCPCPKNSLCSTFLLSPYPLATTKHFIVCIVLSFLNVIQLESYSMQPLQIDFFTQYYEFLPVFSWFDISFLFSTG